MSTVLTLGVFDLMHRGHINRIRQAATYGDYLIVGVQDDESVAKIKAHTIMTTQERIDAVKSLHIAHQVIAYSDGVEQLHTLAPDTLVQGPELFLERDRKDWLEAVIALEIKLVLLPYTKGISTTELRRRASEPWREWGGSD